MEHKRLFAIEKNSYKKISVALLEFWLEFYVVLLIFGSLIYIYYYRMNYKFILI